MISNTNQNKINRAVDGRRLSELETSARTQAAGVPWMLAYIQGATPITGEINRWLYSWTRAELRPTSIGNGHDFRQRPSETWEQGTALNVCEAANSATYVGPGINPANIPAGFTVQPVSGYVMLFAARRCNETTGSPPTTVGGGGSIMWMFHVPNAIDGSC